MKLYSCPKCAYMQEPTLWYHAATTVKLSPCGCDERSGLNGEHLAVECSRCRFTKAAPTADSEQGVAPEERQSHGQYAFIRKNEALKPVGVTLIDGAVIDPIVDNHGVLHHYVMVIGGKEFGRYSADELLPVGP